MSKKSPDHQKREAKRSLWDQDGEHIPKKYRNKGKGRNQEKADIRQELKELEREPRIALDEMLNEEADEALYCHYYGPCEQCLAKEEDDES